jgi:formylmethanofuran dehydrogenase subunit E
MTKSVAGHGLDLTLAYGEQIRCRVCDKLLFLKDVHLIDGRPYCVVCQMAVIKPEIPLVCDQCQQEIPEGRDYLVSDLPFCEDCYNGLEIVSCVRCDYPMIFGMHWTRGENIYCECCVDE